jgi:hypothetical protein
MSGATSVYTNRITVGNEVTRKEGGDMLLLQMILLMKIVFCSIGSF